MSHTYTAKGNKRYRYSVCGTAQQRGWSECPAPSIPAAEIERFVVDQIRGIGRDPDLLRETLQQVHQQVEASQRTLTAERTILQRQVRSDHDVLQAASKLADAIERVSVLATVHERLRVAERRLSTASSTPGREMCRPVNDPRRVPRGLAVH
jgi:site-specific DNA recombinase